MTFALYMLGYTLGVLVCGIAIGATIFLDALAWLSARRQKRADRSKLPRAWVEHLGHLNSPTVWRRAGKRVIDV